MQSGDIGSRVYHPKRDTNYNISIQPTQTSMPTLHPQSETNLCYINIFPFFNLPLIYFNQLFRIIPMPTPPSHSLAKLLIPFSVNAIFG